MQVRRNVIHAGLGLFRRVQHIPGYASPLATSSPRHLRDTSRTSLLMSTSPSFSRHYVSTVPGLPTTPAAEQQQPEPPEPHEESHEAAQPMYEVTFTCRPCSHRSTHQMSKQGFHNGTVLITCPGCGNRHIMSDHLMIFSDRSVTIEDILREKGQLIKRGTLGINGDVEFWEDERETSS